MIDFRMTDDFDIEFEDNGDFKSVDTVETSLPCGLFLEKRDEDISQEIIIKSPGIARGHFGFMDLEASKIWKMYQSRLSTTSLNNSRRYATEGLKFLTVDELVNASNVEATSNGNDIILNIAIEQENLTIERQFTI